MLPRVSMLESFDGLLRTSQIFGEDDIERVGYSYENRVIVEAFTEFVEFSAARQACHRSPAGMAVFCCH